ncbi:outer mitochondrial transmembrane helix translocase isoform X1 [Chelmon rostratus]|uniref:outer mitochondrial transmembrane helix translocase isoform X1 n=1 Tax=Chelmon rostratus TaxID=109905 RepID=UPI001BE53EF8|nr:outer mitochondrial transmembrane helix translocase isoform X1 [Chelmon rostratus]
MLFKDLPREALMRPLSRNEVVGMLLRLTIFGAATYYSIKWVVEAMDPTSKQKNQAKKRAEQLMKRIGVEGVKLTEYEMNIASHLVDPQTMKVSWRDIAGLDEVINELQDTVILPFQKRHLLAGSKLFQPPKGVLLFGPPGCGKTMIAKATAKASGCKFINLQASTLTDMWYGESQKLTAAVFSLAVKIQPCIVFIDEIESFLRNRSSLDHEATAMMKAQFMSLWDGLDTSSTTQVMVMGATNRPQDVDPAILRRMPTTFHVGLPNTRQRQDILRLILAGENTCGCGCCGEVAASHPAGPPLRTGQDEGIQAGHSLQVTQRVGGSPGLTPNTAPPVGNASTQCSQCAPRLQAEAPPTCQRCGWKNQQAAILFLKFIYPGSGCSEHAHFQLNPAACVQL